MRHDEHDWPRSVPLPVAANINLTTRDRRISYISRLPITLVGVGASKLSTSMGLSISTTASGSTGRNLDHGFGPRFQLIVTQCQRGRQALESEFP